MQYIPRVIEPILERYLKSFSIVGITGPRQSGKSTLLLNALSNYEYVTFDDHRNIDTFTEDPIAFIKQFKNKVIFDEIQYVPELFNILKIAVDQDRNNYGKFVITGSNQFSYLQQITESLAGRIGLLSLLPLQYSEIPKKHKKQSMIYGSYPELINKNYREYMAWYSSYIDTYLSKDVRAISNIGNLREFHRFIKLLSANVGQQLVLTKYSNDLGVSATTIKRWISILEASYIIFIIPPYHNNFGKRITKSPKIYFYDTGLVCYMLSIDSEDDINRSIISGHLFENYIISEIKKNLLHTGNHSDLYHLRTSDGKKIDLIIDGNNFQEFIEIKKNTTYRSKMIEHLKEFTRDGNKGVLIYTGESLKHPEPISIVNYQEYLSR